MKEIKELRAEHHVRLTCLKFATEISKSLSETKDIDRIIDKAKKFEHYVKGLRAPTKRILPPGPAIKRAS